jgi:ABC-type maltose transport system permease subunit
MSAVVEGPVMIAFFLQKSLIAGLATGGVKG